MDKPTLWLPYGLYCTIFTSLLHRAELALELKRRRCKLWDLPFSRHPRQPVAMKVWVAVRETAGPPGGMIVDRIFLTCPTDRPTVPLSHDIVDGEGVLRCGEFEVRLLDVYRNCDMLLRGSEFVNWCIKIFGIEPAKLTKQGRPSNDNRRPIHELMTLWKSMPAEQWPSADRLRELGCPEWIIELFQTRLPPGKGSPDLFGMPVFRDIMRELSYDEKTTQIILGIARPMLQAGAGVSEAAVIAAVVYDLALACFTNGERWLTELAESPTDWCGRAYPHIQGQVDRVIADLSGERIRRSSDDTPWQAGKALFAELQKCIPGDGALEDKIGAAFKLGLLHARTADASEKQNAKDRLQRLFNVYLKAKETYACDHFHLVLNQFFAEMRNQDLRPRLVMGYLRLIDQRVLDESFPINERIRTTLETYPHMGEEWRPTHAGDDSILNNLCLWYDPRTGKLIKPGKQEQRLPEADDIGPRSPVDPVEEVAQADYRAMLHKALELSDITDDERYAIAVTLNEQANDRHMHDKTRLKHVRRALEKIKKNLPPGESQNDS